MILLREEELADGRCEEHPEGKLPPGSVPAEEGAHILFLSPVESTVGRGVELLGIDFRPVPVEVKQVVLIVEVDATGDAVILGSKAVTEDHLMPDTVSDIQSHWDCENGAEDQENDKRCGEYVPGMMSETIDAEAEGHHEVNWKRCDRQNIGLKGAKLACFLSSEAPKLQLSKCRMQFVVRQVSIESLVLVVKKRALNGGMHCSESHSAF